MIKVKIPRAIKASILNWMLDFLTAIFVPRKLILMILDFIFFSSFLLSSICFAVAVWHSFKTIFCTQDNIENNIIKGIEIIFLSPIPLLVTTSFYNYYKNIISPSITGDKNDDKYADDSRKRALVDLGIIKYLFISILISTLFVGLLNLFIIIIKDLDKVSQLSFDDQFKKYGPALILAIFILILLLVYFKMLGNNLQKDIEGGSKVTAPNYLDNINKEINSSKEVLNNHNKSK